MGWLPRLPFNPGRGRLQFVKDAPRIQVEQRKPQVIDTRRIAQLADALASLREDLRNGRRAGLSEKT